MVSGDALSRRQVVGKSSASRHLMSNVIMVNVDLGPQIPRKIVETGKPNVLLPLGPAAPQGW
jgi:hypothetical protein